MEVAKESDRNTCRKGGLGSVEGETVISTALIDNTSLLTMGLDKKSNLSEFIIITIKLVTELTEPLWR